MVFNDEDLSYRNGDSSTVSVTDWLLLDAIMLLNLIPIVGSIAAIAVYVVIASTRATAPSVQTRIIVNFIWLGVWLILVLIGVVLAAAGAVGPDTLSAVLGSMGLSGS